MSLPQVSRIGVVVDALKTAFDTISGVNVMDGPTPETLTQQDGIAIGVTDHAYDIKLAPAARLGRGLLDEQIEITCALWSWGGGTDFKPLRDRCVDLLNQVRNILLATPPFNGAVTVARLGERMTWTPLQTTDGALLDVGFTIMIVCTI